MATRKALSLSPALSPGGRLLLWAGVSSLASFGLMYSLEFLDQFVGLGAQGLEAWMVATVVLALVMGALAMRGASEKWLWIPIIGGALVAPAPLFFVFLTLVCLFTGNCL